MSQQRVEERHEPTGPATTERSSCRAGLTDEDFIDPEQVKHLRADQKIFLLLTNVQAIKSLLFNVVEIVVSMLIYAIMGYFANWRYLEWSSELSQEITGSGGPVIEKPLWDAILSQIPELNEDNALVPIGDWFCFGSMGITTLYCLQNLYVDLLNQFAFMISVLIVANMVVENVTVMPSSYGRERCLDFLGLTEETWRSYSFSIAPSGTCAAMMWSGHTVNTVLAGYIFCTALERKYAKVKKVWKRSRTSVSGKVLVVYLWGVIQGVFLVLNHGHYTSDIVVGLVIATLVFSHDKLKYVAIRHNIFLHNTPMAQIRARVQDSYELKELTDFLKVESPELLERFRDPTKERLTVLDYVTPPLGRKSVARADTASASMSGKLGRAGDVQPSEVRAPSPRQQNPSPRSPRSPRLQKQSPAATGAVDSPSEEAVIPPQP